MYLPAHELLDYRCLYMKGTGYTIGYNTPTSLHTPLSTSSSHTSPSGGEEVFSDPPMLINNGRCCPVREPAMQQVVWSSLAEGLVPLIFSLVQCCMDMFKYNYVVPPHMKGTE